MEIPEEGDHDAILAILRPAGEHTLKSILRVIGKETEEIKRLTKPERTQADAYSEWQGKALQAGIKALLGFGGWRDDLNAADPDFSKVNDSYLREIMSILARPQKTINHEYRI